MDGIVSYAAYIPIYRLGGETVRQVWGGRAIGERAVANADEDSLTMGVEAARDCLQGIDKRTVGALYFASTTAPYKEKQSASIIAAALDLREDIVTTDFGDSLRSGTTALRLALDTVKSGSANNVLVIASDCRIPPPGSDLEPVFGDGAAAFLVGQDAPIQIEGSSHTTTEFMDIWRLEYDKFPHRWEERFIIDEGYIPYMQKTISALLQAHDLGVKDFAKACFYAHDARLHKNMTTRLGLDTSQVQEPLFNRVGNTGAAFAAMTLVGALEEAKMGDRILLANYGDGVDAYVIRVAGDIGDNVVSIRRYLDSKTMIDTYGKYLRFKSLIEFEQTPDYAPRTSLSQIWRDRAWVYRFHGHECQKCGKVQFPLQKYCMYCQADEKFLEEVGLSDRKGTLFTFSMDERAPVADPPNVLVAVNLEGGGRFFGQMTDRDIENIRVGMPMELTFRRIHDAVGVHNYFWKSKPAR